MGGAKNKIKNYFTLEVFKNCSILKIEQHILRVFSCPDCMSNNSLLSFLVNHNIINITIHELC